jgi:hypothetical protein
MISDTLQETIGQIYRYRCNRALNYPTDWPEMDDLVKRMEAMRAQLVKTEGSPEVE